VRIGWPGLAAGAVLLGLVSVFYRALLQGRILGDYDAFVYFYPLRYYGAEAIKEGRFPLWNPDLFLGAPFFANVQTGMLYPLNVLFLLLPTPHAFSASVMLHVLLAGIAMYLFARRVLEVSRIPAVIGGTAFMLSGFLSAQVGHLNQLNVSAWLPLLLVAFDAALRRRSLALALVTGLLGAVQFFAGHTQEWYFSMVVLALFALWRVMLPAPTPVPDGGQATGSPDEAGTGKDRAARRPAPIAGASRSGEATLAGGDLWSRLMAPAYLALAVMVLVGAVAVQLLPTLELSGESLRGGGMSYWEATSFSLPPATALYTLLPTYPSVLFSEFIGYVGMVTLVLAVIAVVGWPSRPVAVFMALLAAMGIFMALGRYNPASPILFDLVPGLDMFRVPARWLLVYTFGIAGLAALGAQQLLDLAEWRRTGRQLLSPYGPVHPVGRVLVALLILGSGVGALALFVRMADPAPSGEQVAIWAGLALAAAILAALASLRPRLGRLGLGAMLVLLVLELHAASGHMDFQHAIPAEAFRPDRSSTSFILADQATRQEPGRLLSFATDQYEVKETPDYQKEYASLSRNALHQFLVAVKLSESLAPNVTLEYGLQSIDGYDGGVLPLKRWAEFKALMLDGKDVPPDNPVRRHLIHLPSDHFLDLMNVRYVLGTKIQDTRVDGVYYDRGISWNLTPGEAMRLERLPEQLSTSVGLISSTEGARERPDGSVVAELAVTDEAGREWTLPIRAGMETGETPARDLEFPAAAHSKPKAVAPWTPEIQDEDYYVKIQLPERLRVRSVSVTNLADGVSVRVRAITLIDDVAAISSPLVLSDRLDRELFFDMKVYTNRDPHARAFVVHDVLVRDDEAALIMLRDGEIQVDRTALIAPSDTARLIAQPEGPATGSVRMLSYAPERIVVGVDAARDGYLVLLDTFYPGWRAEVGGQEVPIERANYLFRAVFVPEGQHEVVFTYAPRSLETGLLISVATLVVVMAALAGLAVRRGRRSRPMV
jgi:hypothetical protein